MRATVWWHITHYRMATSKPTSHKQTVRTAGFEPATSCSQNTRAARLRQARNVGPVLVKTSTFDTAKRIGRPGALEPPPGFEPETEDYKSTVIPFNYRGIWGVSDYPLSPRIPTISGIYRAESAVAIISNFV